jgi:small subunit ribosomal protein S17
MAGKDTTKKTDAKATTAGAKPAAGKPAATKPAATKPAATKPVAAKPVAEKAVAAKADAVKATTPRTKSGAKAAKVHANLRERRDVKPAARTGSDQLAGTRVGVVDSDKRNQTRRVVVNYMSKHPKYGKYIRQRTILHVHDERNESVLGDVVEVAPCRPVSKTKRWVLVRVVEKRGEVTAAMASAKAVGEAAASSGA